MNEESLPLDPEIRSISIAGFKSIERIGPLPLRPINVLIGANGSGKSNFINAFSLLQAVRDDTLAAYVERSGGADRILHFGSKITRKLRVSRCFPGWWELRVEPAGSRRRSPHDHNRGRPRQHSDRQTGQYRIAGVHSGSTGALPRVPLSRHERGRRRSSARPIFHDNRYLREDGSNLAAFSLPAAAEGGRVVPHDRAALLRLVAPFFEDFRPGASGTEPGQDPPGVAAPRIGRLFRRLIALRWLAALHRAGDAHATARRAAALGHPAG